MVEHHLEHDGLVCPPKWTNTFPPLEYEELVALFRRADADGSEAVDTSELSSLLAELGVAKTKREVDTLVADMDADADGTLGWEEFVEVVARAKKDAADPLGAMAAGLGDTPLARLAVEAKKRGLAVKYVIAEERPATSMHPAYFVMEVVLTGTWHTTTPDGALTSAVGDRTFQGIDKTTRDAKFRAALAALRKLSSVMPGMKVAAGVVPPAWMAWVHTNMDRGVSHDRILATLVTKGFKPGLNGPLMHLLILTRLCDGLLAWPPAAPTSSAAAPAAVATKQRAAATLKRGQHVPERISTWVHTMLARGYHAPAVAEVLDARGWATGLFPELVEAVRPGGDGSRAVRDAAAVAERTFWAAAEDDAEYEVRLYLSAGMPPDCVPTAGGRGGGVATPALSTAAAAGSLDAMRVLIEFVAGNDASEELGGVTALLDQQDGLGRTALHAAGGGGCADAVALLLAAGASTQVADTYGELPLHLAARNNRPVAAELLANEEEANVRKVYSGQLVLADVPMMDIFARAYDAMIERHLDPYEEQRFSKGWLFEAAQWCYDQVYPTHKKYLPVPQHTIMERVLDTFDPDPDAGYFRGSHKNERWVETIDDRKQVADLLRHCLRHSVLHTMNHRGRTPLMEACLANLVDSHARVIKSLVDMHLGDFYLKDHQQTTPYTLLLGTTAAHRVGAPSGTSLREDLISEKREETISALKREWDDEDRLEETEAKRALLRDAVAEGTALDDESWALLVAGSDVRRAYADVEERVDPDSNALFYVIGRATMFMANQIAGLHDVELRYAAGRVVRWWRRRLKAKRKRQRKEAKAKKAAQPSWLPGAAAADDGQADPEDGVAAGNPPQNAAADDGDGDENGTALYADAPAVLRCMVDPPRVAFARQTLARGPFGFDKPARFAAEEAVRQGLSHARWAGARLRSHGRWDVIVDDRLGEGSEYHLACDGSGEAMFERPHDYQWGNLVNASTVYQTLGGAGEWSHLGDEDGNEFFALTRAVVSTEPPDDVSELAYRWERPLDAVDASEAADPCTRDVFGDRKLRQPWYTCATCDRALQAQARDAGAKKPEKFKMCAACSSCCHAGHERVKYGKTTPAVCMCALLGDTLDGGGVVGIGSTPGAFAAAASRCRHAQRRAADDARLVETAKQTTTEELRLETRARTPAVLAVVPNRSFDGATGGPRLQRGWMVCRAKRDSAPRPDGWQELYDPELPAMLEPGDPVLCPKKGCLGLFAATVYERTTPNSYKVEFSEWERAQDIQRSDLHVEPNVFYWHPAKCVATWDAPPPLPTASSWAGPALTQSREEIAREIAEEEAKERDETEEKDEDGGGARSAEEAAQNELPAGSGARAALDLRKQQLPSETDAASDDSADSDAPVPVLSGPTDAFPCPFRPLMEEVDVMDLSSFTLPPLTGAGWAALRLRSTQRRSMGRWNEMEDSETGALWYTHVERALREGAALRLQSAYRSLHCRPLAPFYETTCCQWSRPASVAALDDTGRGWGVVVRRSKVVGAVTDEAGESWEECEDVTSGQRLFVHEAGAVKQWDCPPLEEIDPSTPWNVGDACLVRFPGSGGRSRATITFERVDARTGETRFEVQGSDDMSVTLNWVKPHLLERPPRTHVQSEDDRQIDMWRLQLSRFHEARRKRAVADAKEALLAARAVRHREEYAGLVPALDGARSLPEEELAAARRSRVVYEQKRRDADGFDLWLVAARDRLMLDDDAPLVQGGPEAEKNFLRKRMLMDVARDKWQVTVGKRRERHHALFARLEAEEFATTTPRSLRRRRLVRVLHHGMVRQNDGRVICEWGCGAWLQRGAESMKHSREQCSKRIIPCMMGCGMALCEDEWYSPTWLMLRKLNSSAVENLTAALEDDDGDDSTTVASEVSTADAGGSVGSDGTREGASRLSMLFQVYHERQACPRRLVPCDRRCGETIHFCDMQHHLDTNCLKRPLPPLFCSLGCGCEFSGPSMELIRTEERRLEHEEMECPLRLVECTWKGCSAIVQANALHAHRFTHIRGDGVRVFSSSGVFRFQVPSSAKQLKIQCWGGGGGTGGLVNQKCGRGGGGALVEALVQVTPNEYLELIVGGGGEGGRPGSRVEVTDPKNPQNWRADDVPGVAAGGHPGGAEGYGGNEVWAAGGGGGYTCVQRQTPAGPRALLVAGGGGGGGSRNGVPGGGLDGEPAGAHVDKRNGRMGTAVSGGAPGDSGETAVAARAPNAGSRWRGGRGATFGGGGGGGVFGGGGGGTSPGIVGGGGGGSSYCDMAQCLDAIVLQGDAWRPGGYGSHAIPDGAGVGEWDKVPGVSGEGGQPVVPDASLDGEAPIVNIMPAGNNGAIRICRPGFYEER